MAHAVWHFAGPGLTLGLEVRFHAPLKPDEQILVRGVLHTKTGSRRLAEGEIIAWPTASASPRARAGFCCSMKKSLKSGSRGAPCSM